MHTQNLSAQHDLTLTQNWIVFSDERSTRISDQRNWIEGEYFTQICNQHGFSNLCMPVKNPAEFRKIQKSDHRIERVQNHKAQFSRKDDISESNMHSINLSARTRFRTEIEIGSVIFSDRALLRIKALKKSAIIVSKSKIQKIHQELYACTWRSFWLYNFSQNRDNFSDFLSESRDTIGCQTETEINYTEISDGAILKQIADFTVQSHNNFSDFSQSQTCNFLGFSETNNFRFEHNGSDTIWKIWDPLKITSDRG